MALTLPISVPDVKCGLAMQFDQSTSAIAIGKINMAATAGEQIPLGWGVDSEGIPTQDPNAVLKGGSLVSSGGYKGYGFDLMAEILAAAFTGGSTSTQLDPLKATEGNPHDLGQCYIIIDLTNVSRDLFWGKLGTISEAISNQAYAWLPGTNKVLLSSVELDEQMWNDILALTQV